MTGPAGRTAPKGTQTRTAGATPDTIVWAALAVAFATVLGLESVRVFVSDSVFVIDQSRRTALLVLMLGVFASPLLAPLVGMLTGGRLLPIAAGVLVVARALPQFIEWPLARVVLGALGFAAFGWLLIPLLRWRARAGLGIVLGCGLDLAIRTARDTIDLPWLPGIGSHLGTAVLLAGLLATLVFVLADRGPLEPRGALGFLALGPALGLAHLVMANLGFATVRTGGSLTLASLVLLLGLLAGLVLLPLATREWIGWAATTLAGALGLWLSWQEGWLGTIGLLASVASWTVFTSTAAIGGRVLRNPTSTGRAALALALGQIVQVVLLFRYYTTTGDRAALLGLWGILALVVALDWPRTLAPGTVALLPHLAIGVLLPLAGAILWQAVEARGRTIPLATIGNELVVMTYNIQSGYDSQDRWNLEATARAIEAVQPDVVLLQEVSRGWLVTSSADQLTWLARRLGMQASWGPASADGLWGNAILTRGRPLEVGTTRFRTTRNLRRGAIAVRLATPQGSVWVASTHLDDPRSATDVRLVQIEELLAFLQSRRPLVLGGDFNADPGSPEYQRLVEAGLIDAASTIGATGPTSADQRRIDYVFVTEEFQAVAGRISSVTASDHRPVVVQLVVR